MLIVRLVPAISERSLLWDSWSSSSDPVDWETKESQIVQSSNFKTRSQDDHHRHRVEGNYWTSKQLTGPNETLHPSPVLNNAPSRLSGFYRLDNPYVLLEMEI